MIKLENVKAKIYFGNIKKYTHFKVFVSIEIKASGVGDKDFKSSANPWIQTFNATACRRILTYLKHPIITIGINRWPDGAIIEVEPIMLASDRHAYLKGLKRRKIKLMSVDEEFLYYGYRESHRYGLFSHNLADPYIWAIEDPKEFLVALMEFFLENDPMTSALAKGQPQDTMSSS